MNWPAIVYNQSKTHFFKTKYFLLDFIRIDPCASTVSSAGTRKAATGLDGYAAASA